MMVFIVYGSVLSATEKYIIHQCNCETAEAAGLAYEVFKKYPYANVYKYRRHDELSYDTPGTIVVKGGHCQEKARGVINLFGQRHKSVPNSSDDTYEMRMKWFKSALEAVACIPDVESVAFPHGIGCGMAGGKWEDYYAMITEWSERHPKISVVIYKYDNNNTNSTGSAMNSISRRKRKASIKTKSSRKKRQI